MDQYMHLRQQARDAFEIRYERQVDPDRDRWELCSRVLARRDIVEKLSMPWVTLAEAPVSKSEVSQPRPWTWRANSIPGSTFLRGMVWRGIAEDWSEGMQELDKRKLRDHGLL